MTYKPLVSIFITYYNTGEIVYETLDSVFAQDYNNIELIVSDDYSERVPMGDIESYIDSHKGDNIKNVIIRRNDSNVGTVKHVEIIRDLCSGEFCFGIAGDDLFGSDDVISKMVEKFEQLGPSAEYMIGQVEMFDQNMEKSSGFCVEKPIIKLLEEERWDELLNKEAETSRLVGQCMCRTSLFSKLPKFSEEYKFVEDYSCHMWLLHNNIPIYWCNMVIIKHRGGGISHGNLANKKEFYALYCQDYMTVYETQVAPYKDKIDIYSYEQAFETYQFFKYQKETTLRMSKHPVLCRLLLAQNASDYSSRVGLVKNMISYNVITKSLMTVLMLMLTYSFQKNIFIKYILAILSIVFGLITFASITMFILYYLYKIIKLVTRKYF